MITVLPNTVETTKLCFTIPTNISPTLNYHKHFNFNYRIQLSCKGPLGSARLELPITVFPNYFEPSLNKNKIFIIQIEKEKIKNFNEFFDDLESFSKNTKNNNNNLNHNKKNKISKIENHKNFDIAYQESPNNVKTLTPKQSKLKRLGRRTYHLESLSMQDLFTDNKDIFIVKQKNNQKSTQFENDLIESIKEKEEKRNNFHKKNDEEEMKNKNNPNYKNGDDDSIENLHKTLDFVFFKSTENSDIYGLNLHQSDNHLHKLKIKNPFVDINSNNNSTIPKIFIPAKNTSIPPPLPDKKNSLNGLVSPKKLNEKVFTRKIVKKLPPPPKKPPTKSLPPRPSNLKNKNTIKIKNN